MRNSGIQNEYDFINKLNDKRVYELDFLLRDFIESIFPTSTKNSIVKCRKGLNYEKTDIIISVGSKCKNVSIKVGYRNSVHCEKLKKFIKFLKQLGVEDRIINMILKYHYGDNTINGKGSVRMSACEYKKANCEEINEINSYLNNEFIISKCINRFIFQGTQSHLNKIDILICGTVDDFFYITADEIYQYILSKTGIESSAIHFSCLTFQPLSRVLNFDPKYEYMRDWIQIKWYNLEDNIFEILNLRYQKDVV